MPSTKGGSREEFRNTGRRSHGGAGTPKPKNDPNQKQVGDFETGSGGGAGAGSGKPPNLSPNTVKRLAEILIPVVKAVATSVFPPLGPIFDVAYALYTVYRNKEKLTEIAEKVSDNDIEGLAWMAAKEIAKKGVAAVADSAAEKLANESATRLKDAGLFSQIPEAEAYYKEFVTDEIGRLIIENGEEFVDKL